MSRITGTVLAVLVILVAIAGNTYIGLSVKSRQSTDEHSTCVIQARGLRGQRHLTAIMRDVAMLLTPIPGVHGAPVPGPLIIPLANLREQVGAYLTIENEQPAGRNC